jgi:pimeloyl-ACP methyl ester carboxylesterase
VKQLLRYAIGEVLSYVDYGDKNRFPILIQHGMIACITDVHLFDRLVQAGKRVISVARPGYGYSSPYEMRNIAEWGEIVSFLVEALHLTQFDVLGMSSGAPYSYAIGYRLPEKVRKIFIFSGTPALYDERVVSLWPYEVNKNASLAELQKLAKELFFSNLSEEDLLRNDIRDSMRNECFGIALDLKLRCVDWGINLSEVKTEVVMQHSRADQSVPFVTAEITASLLPNCRLEIRDSGEHFSEEILDQFIASVMLSHNQT